MHSSREGEYSSHSSPNTEMPNFKQCSNKVTDFALNYSVYQLNSERLQQPLQDQFLNGKQVSSILSPNFRHCIRHTLNCARISNFELIITREANASNVGDIRLTTEALRATISTLTDQLTLLNHTANLCSKTMSLKLLLLSNSRNESGYLQLWKKLIRETAKDATRILFVPFAAVTIDWKEYTRLVSEALDEFKIENIADFENMTEAVNNAEVICIGGGNTFALLHQLQIRNLLVPIRNRVLSGVPYIGWSAGANVASVDICSTNDMPIVWPSSCDALALVPYNVNPHFTEFKQENYFGENRAQRLNECCLVRKRPIVALSEGTAIIVNGSSHTTIDADNVRDAQCKIWLPDDASNSKIRIDDIPMRTDIYPIIENCLKA